MVGFGLAARAGYQYQPFQSLGLRYCIRDLDPKYEKSLVMLGLDKRADINCYCACWVIVLYISARLVGFGPTLANYTLERPIHFCRVHKSNVPRLSILLRASNSELLQGRNAMQFLQNRGWFPTGNFRHLHTIPISKHCSITTLLHLDTEMV
jgi:hypothetical protein